MGPHDDAMLATPAPASRPGPAAPATPAAQQESPREWGGPPTPFDNWPLEFNSVFWDEVRPDRMDVDQERHEPANALQSAVASSAIARGWAAADVTEVLSLLRIAEHDPYLVSTLPMTGPSFLANIDDYMPYWQKKLAHKSSKVRVDEYEYDVFYWDPLIQLGVILSQPLFAKHGVFRFTPAYNNQNERVYDEPFHCRRFEGTYLR